ncbi:uncharacterized protein LOC116606487 [Nematostella vectensis]|nr:uncharacterized protein LOC116606487 [Nematostella vectensis]XP_032224631.1 uncharacterized protein LOC116606487 [Nematostella vectensis]XP_032224632.1 uncharacterized protein LOC116606487 [Nematostella vectensis]
MLKFLTLKFRNQSLNEVRPFEPQGFLRQDTEIQNVEKGDEEDEEILSINDEVSTNNNNNNEESAEDLDSTKQTACIEREDSSDQENQPPFQLNDGLNNVLSNDFLPIQGMDIPNTTVSDCASFAAEKRKWSQMNSKFLHQLQSGTDSSSDDEIKELCSRRPSHFSSSSPPGKVTVLSKHSAFCARIRPTEGYGHGHTRKKHRVIICEERPWLNFEKMQQKTLSKKYSHTASRPRVVRIRNISHASTNLRPVFNCDPAIRSFRPIPLNAAFNLAPVEEPGCAF